MYKYILRRLVQSIPIFVGITFFTYLLLWLSPGSVIERLYLAPNITAEARERLAAQLGINDPFHVQYIRWLLGDDWMRWDSDGDGVADKALEFFIPLDANGDGEPEPPGDRKGIIRGDFGTSFVQKQPVLDLIIERLKATLELGMAALLTSVVIGIPIGVVSAAMKGRWFDNLSRVMAVFFNAIPGFWLGLMLILFFGSQLGWLPLGARCGATLTGVCPPMLDRLEYLLMPTFVLAATNIAIFSRYMRTATLEVLGQDYIRTAFSKGMPRRSVYFKHALRNALVPIATLLGPIVTNLWGGAVVTETVFAWPGVGRVAFQAAIQQDHPVVMAVVIFAAIGTILGFLLSDIMYVIIDPRIRLE